MRRALTVAAVLAALTACTGEPPPPSIPLEFTVIQEGQNTDACVEGPDFLVALDEDEWIDAFVLQSSCVEERDVRLPDVDFTRRMGVAVWWRLETCRGVDVTTRQVLLRAGDVIVSALTDGPGEDGPCLTTQSGLESFLTVERRPTFERVVFLLDGQEIGTVALEPG